MEKSFLTVADSYLKLEQFKEAEEHYKKALEYNPQSADAFIGLFLCQYGYVSLGALLENADSATLFSVPKNKNLSKALKFASDEYRATLSEFSERAKLRAAEVKKREEEVKKLLDGSAKRAKEIAKFYEVEGCRIISCKKVGAEPEFFDEISEIGARAFENIKSLKRVELPEIISFIGDNAFCGCKNLAEVKILRTPDYMGDGVFADCVNLKSVTLPEYIKGIERRTFFNCSGLEEIEIPAEVKTICESAFDGCYNLKGITLPEEVEKIGDYAFYGCEGIEKLIIPQSVKGIGKSAFERCSLKEVTLPQKFKKHRREIFGGKLGGLFSKVKFTYI